MTHTALLDKTTSRSDGAQQQAAPFISLPKDGGTIRASAESLPPTRPPAQATDSSASGGSFRCPEHTQDQQGAGAVS